jgi:hypothetical protein
MRCTVDREIASQDDQNANKKVSIDLIYFGFYPSVVASLGRLV